MDSSVLLAFFILIYCVSQVRLAGAGSRSDCGAGRRPQSSAHLSAAGRTRRPTVLVSRQPPGGGGACAWACAGAGKPGSSDVISR